MGNLKDKIFYRAINDSIDGLRKEMCDQHKPKKEDRFFINGITYEISEAKLVQGGVHFEISSKIPQEILPKKGLNEKYFKNVRDLMNAKGKKKPIDVKMENIIRSTNVNEIKERDYVKCTYMYKDSELFADKEVGKIVKQVMSKKLRLPAIRGITTIAGQAVIYLMQENIYNGALRHITDLIKSNEEVMKKYKKALKKGARV